MLEEIGEAGLAILAGVVALATISVIIGRNSQAPAAIQATGGAFAQIIGAAVNPAATAATNGTPELNAQSSANSGNSIGSLLGSAAGSLLGG
jgi:hypothetical protein